ncbi:protein disulfide isomerase-like 1-6 [Andrographis paniculata]|uniref:protein disulfide isomerase-like 1-6 n=1 Tax=Andrographis paniculata TaxID=175694 RepID=UPI0021E91782|nr:protein disulfide isomerase-like 1-6 [Andrographis paniculata]
MYRFSFTSRSLLLPFILLFLLLTTASSQLEDADDFEDLDHLIAIDNEQDDGAVGSDSAAGHEIRDGKKSEAEVVSKAQRIVLELNGDNTNRTIQENQYVLLLGYAPWCGRSAELMPRFAEAANRLKALGSGVLMAKLDAERYPKAASSLGIKGFPTLLLFINGDSHPYTGGFSAEEMVIWARKKTGAPVVRISSIAMANEFVEQQTMYAVGVFDKFEGLEYEEFVKAAVADNEIQFVETISTEAAKVLYPVAEPMKPFFGLVKNEPEYYTPFDGALRLDSILQFLDNNKFPLVTVMTELNLAKVYSNPNKLQVYVFTDADNLKKLLEPLRSIAKKFKSEMIFIAADIKDDNLAKPFLTLFGQEESNDTVVVAFNYNSNSKYLLESDPTSENIEEFCSQLQQGTLSPHYKSESIPDNKNASILTVVGKTFDDIILRSSKNILLEVHTPWCITCETTSKHVEKLAKHFKGLDNLVFARIDASTNEHPKLQVEDYPTLLFYPANDKTNPSKLPTKSGLKELAALINKNLKAQQDSVLRDEL